MNTISDQTRASDDGLLLIGLDGTNPLGFLAALGLFRIAYAYSCPSYVRLRWISYHSSWVPSLIGIGDKQSDLDSLKNTLCSKKEDHPIIRMLRSEATHDKEEGKKRREWFEDLVNTASQDDRLAVDMLAAFRSDVLSSEATSQLQVVRRDYFVDNLVSIIKNTCREHLDRAIFHPWDFSDPIANQSLHFDPVEDRRHAYRWNQPSGDPDLKKTGGMLGANRLAIEALPLFTSVPSNEKLRTIGFTGYRSDNTRWTWPIWNIPLSLPVISSLLAMQELQEELLSDEHIRRLRLRGIAAVLRTDRILVGKTPNFTPPQRIA